MSLFPEDLLKGAADLLAASRERGVRIVTAESCTGGLIGGLLTEIAGSSDVFERGFIVYSNHAKIEALGVPARILKAHGAVSAEAVAAMAEGALMRARADLAIAVSGIAGPGGGGPDKPVGLVHLATARRLKEGVSVHPHEERYGAIGRGAVRLETLRTALILLKAAL